MLDESICHFRECRVYFVAFILLLMENPVLIANNEDPDQDAHYVTII